jgi:hypothetical protein
MSTVAPATAPVQKSVTVKAGIDHAFRVFTEGFDTWWPRSHHTGDAPLATAVIEGREGGRCYGRSIDGAEWQWGRVTRWEPPTRFVFAWMLNSEWKADPDPAHWSEVEVRFTSQPDGGTRVDLEHRHFERHGQSAPLVRAGVDSPEGWGGLIALYAAEAEREM